MLGKDLRVFSEQYSVGGGGISRDNRRCFSGLDNLSWFSSVAAMTVRARLLVVGEGVLAMGVGGSDAMKSAVGPRANGDPRIVGRRPDVTRRYAVSSCFGLDEACGLMKCSGLASSPSGTKNSLRKLGHRITDEPVGTGSTVEAPSESRRERRQLAPLSRLGLARPRETQSDRDERDNVDDFVF